MDNCLSLQYLAVQPLPHQLEGIQWMLHCETHHNRGGILANDTSLGKSLQTLATIVNHPIETTLIILPMSLVSQWKQEIETKLTRKLNVGIYHGANRHKMDFSTFDIILTTYSCLAREFDKNDNDHKEKTSYSRFHPYTLLSTLFSTTENKRKSRKQKPLMEFRWGRVILDECRIIKNELSLAARAAYNLKARFRWCLSRMSIQNHSKECMSMYRFVMGKNAKSGFLAKDEMKTIVLRRKKEDSLPLPEEESKTLEKH